MLIYKNKMEEVKQITMDIIREENSYTKANVMELLGWTSLQYAEFQEEMGYVYLHEELGLQHALVREFVYTRHFWGWWIKHWIKRDVQFLKTVHSFGAATWECMYKAHHRVSSDIFRPHKEMMKPDIEKYIKHLEDENAN